MLKSLTIQKENLCIPLGLEFILQEIILKSCTLGCNSNEDQRHIFENCEVLKSN